MTHPYDNAGLQVIENGDTEDGAYLAPVDIGGIGLWQPYNQGTERGFTMADNAIMDGADLDILVVFQHGDSSAARYLFSKQNFTSSRREWAVFVSTTPDLRILISDDGAATSVQQTFGALSLTEGSWYAVRATYDESLGTIDWESYDAAAVLAIVADGTSGITEVAAQLTPTATEQDTFAAITMHNATASLCVGGYSVGASDNSITSPAAGPIRYAQVVFDGGTVTFDPTRDAAIGSTSFTDSDSALSWALQTTTTQTDWPTLATPALSFDGGDWLATSYTPTFTATTGELTVYVVTTAGTGTFDYFVDSESAALDGLRLASTSTATTIEWRVGGATTNVQVTAAGALPASTRASIGGVVGDNSGTHSIRTYDNTNGIGSWSSIEGVGTITHNPVQVGARSFDDAGPLDGTIETVLIFERALTAAELASLDAHYRL